MFAAFDNHETVSCNSVLNVTQYSADLLEVVIAIQNILSDSVTLLLNALQTTNPRFVADFSAIRSDINRSSAPLILQLPRIFEYIQQTSKDCALVLQRCAVLCFNF
jgi:hypothetical protein